MQDLLRTNTHGSEVILDLLESLENCLTVRGDIGVIRGGVLVELRATESAIKNSLGDGRPNRPEAAWPLKEVLRRRAFKAPVGRECNAREERAVTNSNDGVVFRERARSAAAMSSRCSGNCSGTPTGIGGGPVSQRFQGKRKIRGHFAEQRGNGRSAALTCAARSRFRNGVLSRSAKCPSEPQQ